MSACAPFIIFISQLLICGAFAKSSYSFTVSNFIRNRRQTADVGCTLPAYPEHGRWKLLNGEAYPGDKVQIASVIIFECNSGYKVSSKIPLVCLGEWSSRVPECEELCPPLYSSNTYDVRCTDKVGKEVNCNEASHGTDLEYTCKTYYETPFGYKKTLFCENGKWDNSKPACHPVCGKKVTDDTKKLIYGAKPNQNIEHPWVAAIFAKLKDSYENVCGGSILSQTVILTAAHCVTNDYGNVLPKENYMVGVGKLYRSYRAPEDTRAQYLELSKIIVPEEYKGDIRRYAADIAVLVVKGEIILNEVIQPVCFTNIKNIHLHAGNRGEVSGWGLAEGNIPSKVLRNLVIPYKYETVCADELPPEWADRYNLKDKICAGFINKSTSVCSGDSGGGLAFKYREDNRYYIHGIVSIAHQAGYKCNIPQNALYTSVASHYDFVDRLLTKYAPKTKNCVLPPHPQNGKWVTDQPDLKPGDVVPSNEILRVVCDKSSRLSSTRIVECSEAHDMPRCDMTCNTPRFPGKTYYRCANREGQDIPCSTAVEGTTIYYSCPNKYTPVDNVSNRTCEKGSWGSPTPECIRECGRKVVDDAGEGYEYPWHIGIYQKNNNTKEKYKYICGGSLVSEYLVVTAAQCLINEEGRIVPKEDYSVAGGKLYRSYDDSRDKHAQISDITYIVVHPVYNGTGIAIYNIAIIAASSSFVFNAFVQPICITEAFEFWCQHGQTGIMVGWRSAEENSTETVEPLEVVNLSDNDCKIPSQFSHLFTVLFTVENKCIGFKDNSTCMLPEDRGNGIVAKNMANGRYHLETIAISYENGECLRNFWSFKLGHFSDIIYSMIHF